MFKRIEGERRGAAVHFDVDGIPVCSEEGVTLALALLEAGFVPTRVHPVRGDARAPYCLMGACFECLVHLDGQTNVQSCQVKVRAGMVVQLPIGSLEIEE